MDLDDDLEAAAPGQTKPPPPYDGPRAGSAHNRDASPLPAPIPTKPTPLPRESLDGETIFAVGDEDRLTDDEEDDDSENKRLTGKSS